MTFATSQLASARPQMALAIVAIRPLAETLNVRAHGAALPNAVSIARVSDRVEPCQTKSPAGVIPQGLLLYRTSAPASAVIDRRYSAYLTT